MLYRLDAAFVRHYTRATGGNGRQKATAQPSQHPHYAQRDLSALVVQDFGVAILPSADHWWQYHNTTELGKALAEAGHLVVGYGMPWLAGELMPPEG